MTTANRYVMAGSAADKESIRLGLLEELFDVGTKRRLAQLGVGAGWRCLEVGAGQGSVTSWLAQQAGPSGSVVAIDIDPRFLRDPARNVEVRQMDIRTGKLEAGGYDLAHCRMVLMHLSDAEVALARMVDALKPGGVLLVEEADHGLMHFCGPGGAALSKATVETMANMQKAGIMQPYFGRVLPDAVFVAGLTTLRVEVETHAGRPGETAYDWIAATLTDAGTRLVAAGIASPAWLEQCDAYFGQEQTCLTTMSLCAVAAQKPNR